MNSFLRRAITSSLAMGLCLIAAPAFAQNTEGAFQLGLSTPIFDYSTGSVEIELPGGDRDLDISTTRFGVEEQAVLELGYGIGDMFVLGGFLQLGISNSKRDPEIGVDEEDSETDIAIGPKFDVMFAPGQSVRPFIGAAIGFASTKATEEAGDASTETSASGVLLEARGGIRWFPTPGFSLDPALVLGFRTLSGEIETDTGPLTASTDLSGSAFHVGINVGFSGWIM